MPIRSAYPNAQTRELEVWNHDHSGVIGRVGDGDIVTLVQQGENVRCQFVVSGHTPDAPVFHLVNRRQERIATYDPVAPDMGGWLVQWPE